MAENKILTQEDDCLEQLENFLKDRVVEAMRNGDLSSSVHGAFSIDDLEKQDPGAIGLGKVLFGVVYVGCNAAEAKEPKLSDGGNGAQFTAFHFKIIVGGRVDTLCKQRQTHGRILTRLRKEIALTHVQYGRRPEMTRPWVFVNERPEIAESTEEMLYYSQTWSISLPLVSK